MRATEFLIVGTGIVGLAIGRKLLSAGALHVTFLDKESRIGCHASGRNSGVLHAGIYYPPKTLKAQLCLQGNRQWQTYCQARGLPLERNGKVIVAKNREQVRTIHTLFDRAQQNGAHVELVSEETLKRIEPTAKTCEVALYAHDTAVVDPLAILKSLEQELRDTGRATFLLDTQVTGANGDHQVQTTRGPLPFEYLINTAGAYADQVAKLFGLAQNYRLIPFKGIYQKLKSEYAHLIKGNIYPVPHPDNPFLGVHFTKNIHGEVYVGPTAIPAFGRENYGFWEGISWEAAPILWEELTLFFSNKGFRKVALEEPKKYWPAYFYQDAKQLVHHLDRHALEPALKCGIRPQLINRETKKLEMDFLILKEKNTLHILNAISPAFTSALAFADHVIQYASLG